VQGLLETNHGAVLARIAAACAEGGREVAELRLLAVTKAVEPALAHALFELGCRELGENRVPELERKVAWFRERESRPRWHFIGHLQRNKARRVLRLADEIHSVDSPRLLEALARIGDEEERWPGIYLQAKLTEEEAKEGAPPERIERLVAIARSTRLPLLGLMTMAAPVPPAPSSSRHAPPAETFAALRRLAAALPGEAFVDGRPQLSMGMSGDLEDAIGEGATIVRVGSSLFEGLPRSPRPAPPTGGDR
jgi:PLP dependent protein